MKQFNVHSRLLAFSVILLSACISLNTVLADVPNFRWAQTAGGTSREYGTGIAVDAAGNSYAIGKFLGSHAVFGSFTLTNGGLFIAKYDTNGTAIWARQVSPESSVWDHNIATDGAGNTYVAGSFLNSLDFGGVVLTNGTPGWYEVFIAKYDSVGNLAWAIRAGRAGITNDMRAFSLAVDAASNSFIAGDFYGTAHFGTTNFDAGNVQGIFLVKYDTAGSLVWARAHLAPDGGPDLPSGVALDGSGNCYFAGYFHSPTLAFGAVTLTNSGNRDLFVVKCDPDGNVLWAKGGGGSGQDNPAGFALDSSGACYLGGSISGDGTANGSVSFDGCTVTSVTFFLVKYDRDGNVVWCEKSADFNSNPFLQGSIQRSAADAEGNSYLLGQFFSTATFDNITLTNRGGNWDSPNGYPSYFVAKLDTDGHTLWAKQFGGADAEYNYFEKGGIAVDAVGNCNITGFIRITNAAFDNFTLSTSGDEDVFVARIDADPPRLNIFLAGNAAVISWPTNQPAFQLESAPTLSLGANWSAVTNSAGVFGNQNFVTNEVSGNARFYRLRKL